MASMEQPAVVVDNDADWGRKPNRVSTWNRNRKWRAFTSRVRFDADTKVLDVGYSDEEYAPTDNFLEKHYPYLSNITALGVEEPVHFRQRYPEVEVITYDGKSEWPFGDQAFDLVWTNAVIEHVGGYHRQVHFAREAARVGRRVWMTTPNRFFPIEVHTRTPLLHWLPMPLFYRYLHHKGKSWAADDYMWLLSARQLKRILRDAGVTNYQIKRNRVGPFTLDFVVIIG